MTMEDPDVDLFFDTRQVGEFGIYMAKQIMDTVSYEFNDGCNILTMEKRLS